MEYLLALFLFLLSTGALGLLWIAPRKELGESYFRVIAWIFGIFLILGAGLALKGGGPPAGLWSALLTASSVGAVVHLLALRGGNRGLEELARGVTVLAGLAGAILLTQIVLELPGLTELAFLGVGAISSAFLLGAVVTAMLVGHWYLINPKLDFFILRRFTAALGLAAGVKLLACVVGVALLGSVSPRLQGDLLTLGSLPNLVWMCRVAVGALGPALLTWMAWDCVLRESNQSATGLLYVTICFVLGGEGLALVLAGFTGVLL